MHQTKFMKVQNLWRKQWQKWMEVKAAPQSSRQIWRLQLRLHDSDHWGRGGLNTNIIPLNLTGDYRILYLTKQKTPFEKTENHTSFSHPSKIKFNSRKKLGECINMYGNQTTHLSTTNRSKKKLQRKLGYILRQMKKWSYNIPKLNSDTC